MEKDRFKIHGSSAHNHPNARDNRTAAVDGSISLRSDVAAVSTAARPQPTPSDFVLQWGNRKRLRCMKVQVRARDMSSTAGPVHRATVRADRRVVRAEIITKNQQPSWIHNNNPNQSNGGYLNLRQRPFSPQPPPSAPPPPPPPQRVPRNSEISGAMRGHNNTNGGFRSITSPEKRPPPPPLSNHDNNHQHKSGGTVISESKKGGSSSGSGEAVAPPLAAAMWPPKFVIALTNKEKEEDFMAIKGCKLPQRPKKRAKIIQRTINLVSPGTWLCDLTLERYEVREKKISKKKPRGLKAIVNNMESDSE